MAGSCNGCRFSAGKHCMRDVRVPPFTKSYELAYTDRDFCGPTRKHYRPLSLFERMARIASRKTIKGGDA